MKIINTPKFFQEHPNRLRDWTGFAFFLFITLISIHAAWRHPSALACLYAIHNGLLAIFYTRRRPAKNYDRIGFWLGMVAAFLPTFTITGPTKGYFLVPALAAYALILWSLITLGRRFGIAPADRGLTNRGPYRFLRHPMYLGELVFRLAMVLSSSHLFIDLALAILLCFIQCWRILREEKSIEGYSCYQRIVPWRLIPGVW